MSVRFKEFLHLLWENDWSGYLEIRTISKNGGADRAFFSPEEIEKVDGYLKGKIHRNVYFGVCPRARQAGGLDAIAEVRTLWVDIDYKETPKEEVRRKAEEFPLTPPIIVLSGGGIHVYFPLKEPFEVKEEADRVYIRALLRKLARFWGGDMASTDLARILRVPGTVNHKYNPPRPVKLIVRDMDKRFNLSDFDFLGVEYEEIKENLKREKEGRVVWRERKKYPPETANVMVERCRFLKHCVEDAKTLPEPHWWAMITNLATIEEGEEAIHRFSAPYPGYTREETDAKIQRAEENFAKGIGPHTCEYISTLYSCPKDCELKQFGATPASAAFAYLKGGKNTFWGEEERKAEIIYISSLLKGKRKKIDKTLLRNFTKVAEVLETKGLQEAEQVFESLLLSDEERELARSYHDFIASEEALEKLRIARVRFSLFMTLRHLEQEVRESGDVFALMDRLAEELIETEEEMDFWKGQVRLEAIPPRMGKIKVVPEGIKEELERLLEKEKDYDAIALYSSSFPRRFLLQFLPRRRELLPQQVYSFGTERGSEGRFWMLLRGLKGYKVLVVLFFTDSDDERFVFSLTTKAAQFASLTIATFFGEKERVSALSQGLRAIEKELAAKKKKGGKNEEG